MKELKASDLRIGNLIWLKIHHHPVIVEQIYIPSYDNNFWLSTDLHEGERIEDYEPIPLTEELLLKLGFQKFKYNDGYYVIPYYQKGCITIEGIDFDIELFNGEKLNIDYVHQIQNIYYALHGEELTINN